MIKRIKYKNCPLVEVVVQVNFPPILSIEATTPYEFQELIRSEFPEYIVQPEYESQLLINSQNPQISPLYNQKRTRSIHMFTSDNGLWKLSLSNNMLSLSSLKYDCWEDMKDKFSNSFKALLKVYKPSYFNRIALRYIDAFEKDKLNLLNSEWSELLNPHICGCFGYTTDGQIKVKTNRVDAEIQFENATVKVIAGIGNVNHHDGNPPTEAFILDCDYYNIGRFRVDQFYSIADSIHERTSLFFRDAITEKLHNAMDPDN